MSEAMQVVTMSLAEGRDWRVFADLNIVGLSDKLDAEGRARAIQELSAHAWATAVFVA